MKITKYLPLSQISADLEAKDKKAAIEFLLKMMTDRGMVQAEKAPEVYQALLEREALTSTGLGYGLALPHVRTEVVPKIELVFARSRKGVDFEALDGNPVYFLFLVLAPARCVDEYLKVISLISSLMKNESVRQRLLSAKNAEEIFGVIDRAA
jgi:mannitol/fructose-specific phosphotransferase system IIA component (Ntr-type)